MFGQFGLTTSCRFIQRSEDELLRCVSIAGVQELEKAPHGPNAECARAPVSIDKRYLELCFVSPKVVLENTQCFSKKAFEAGGVR